MNFDPRTAKSLPPGQHITFPEYPGLRLVISKSRRTWTYRYKSPVNSNMRQVAIGYWPAMSFPAAIAEWEKLRIQRDSGVDLENKSKAVSAPKKPEIYTVQALCNDYITGYIEVNRKAKGAYTVISVITRCTATIQHLPAIDVDRQIAFELISHVAKKTPALASTLRSLLGAAWDFALDAGRLPDTAVNWWRLILKGKIKSKGKRQNGRNIGIVKRVLSDEELGALIRWMPNFNGSVRDILMMYLWTATRGAEIVAMKGCEVFEEPDGWVWIIPKAKTKNARHERATDQRVPLVGKALEIVKSRLNPGYLFPARDKKSHISQISVSVFVNRAQPYNKAACKKLPVTNWCPHDLRRTSRTILAKLGCPDAVAESILGHVIPGVMGVYNRYQYDEEKRVWLIKLSDYLEGLVAG